MDQTDRFIEKQTACIVNKSQEKLRKIDAHQAANPTIFAYKLCMLPELRMSWRYGRLNEIEAGLVQAMNTMNAHANRVDYNPQAFLSEELHTGFEEFDFQVF